MCLCYSFFFPFLFFFLCCRLFTPYCLLELFSLRALLLSSRIDYEIRKSKLSLKLTRRHINVYIISYTSSAVIFFSTWKHLLYSMNSVAQCSHTKTEVCSVHNFYLYCSFLFRALFSSFMRSLLEIIFNSFPF